MNQREARQPRQARQARTPRQPRPVIKRGQSQCSTLPWWNAPALWLSDVLMGQSNTRTH